MIMFRNKIQVSVLGVCAALACILIASSRAAIKETPPPGAKEFPASIMPAPGDGRIAYVAAQQLALYHYSQQPLDSEMSKKFFDGYLEALDLNRENFLQSDIAEFMHYRTNLDLFTVGGRGSADLTPAYDIFQRYLERFEQHATYAEELLKHDNFKFTGDDRVSIDRRHAPYPQDLDAAKEIWCERLRSEYLQEKLSREISPTNGALVMPLPKSADADIREKLARHYNWLLRMATNWDSSDVLQIYLDALAHAYDPHSDYLNKAHAQQFSVEMSLGLFGIGAQLGEEDGYCKISSLVPGGPAAISKKLNEGDEIVAVAQTNQPPVDVVDMDLTKVVQLIRGPKGTQVRLTISPVEDRTARRVVTLVRDEIKIEDSQARAELIVAPDGHGGTNRLGVIDLPEFYFPTDLSGDKDHLTPKFASVDVAKLVKKLKEENVGGIILDLRGNPGGSLEEALRLTGLFIKSGPVVLARAWDGQIAEDDDPNSGQLYAGPLVVLVNRFSASASEIVAAALQDYGRALVVGDISTHGKGTVQQPKSLEPLLWEPTNDPGDMKITIAKFYRINGASTQLKGVVPDIVLPDVVNYSDEVGETSLENPLPWDTIPGADYDKLGLSYDKFNLVAPYVDALRRESEGRTATNQDFIYIAQDIARFKKLQADKTATLNEREAIKERQENYARDMAREAERAARPMPDETVYSIAITNAETAGLPAPEQLTATNESALLIATNENGTVSIMTTNDAVVTGIPLNPPATNSLPVEVITKTQQVDPMLNETENIIEDYIQALSANHPLIANQ
jgi:carboxyl-terminal processing protease